jgi:hypothetical protein
VAAGVDFSFSPSVGITVGGELGQSTAGDSGVGGTGGRGGSFGVGISFVPGGSR